VGDVLSGRWHDGRNRTDQAGDKENSGHTPAAEQSIVDIAVIDSHNRAWIQMKESASLTSLRLASVSSM
jgi:hypothetical protein